MNSFPYPSLEPRHIPAQNVVVRLVARETHGTTYRRHCRLVDTKRSFYTNIVPNFTLINVRKPMCFLRKFTPDGKRFIAISNCQRNLEIYLYKGPEAMNDLLVKYSSESQTKTDGPLSALAFDRFFTEDQTIWLSAESGQQLNRECSLFTEDGDYVIVGSASFVPDDQHPPAHELHRNNESVAPNPRNPIENYTLFLVSIHEGYQTDKICFKNDKIFLSHNQGLYLCKDTLAVLSVQHQTIHIYKLEHGKFVPVTKVGRLLYEDDEYLLSRTLSADQQTSLPGQFVYRPYREQTINQLKHRVLVYLFRRAEALSARDGSPFELRLFYLYFDHLRSLRIWKMQLLDPDVLLIKYASEDVVTLRSTEPNSQIAFFVVYNHATTQVLNVFDNTSDELVGLFENFCDHFRQMNLTPDYEHFRFTNQASSPSNNIYAQLAQYRFKQAIVSAKNGGEIESRRRVLAQLPISAQSYSSSPYLDLSLFSYDEKWVSVMERPKASSDRPILFYGRECGMAKFSIYTGPKVRQASSAGSRRLVAFIFHPTDPFVISVQKTNYDYVINIHIRHPREANGREVGSALTESPDEEDGEDERFEGGGGGGSRVVGGGAGAGAGGALSSGSLARAYMALR